MAMSVDGLVTGMSTTDTIRQLMQVEALPQQALKNKVGVANKAVTAYQSVNTKMLALVTAAKALSGVDAWGAVKATSSSDAAAVTAAPGASAGSLSFRVEQLAATHTMTFKDGFVGATTDSVLDGATLDITLKDGTTKQLTPTDGSLKSVVAAINGDAESLYTAAAVQIGPNQYTLQLSARTSGQAAAFTADKLPTGLSAGIGAATTTVEGTDARLKVGSTADAYEITSATNTFADVLDGVTVTAAKVQAPTDPLVTVTLTRDAEGIATKVQALVDGANAALSEIATQTRGKNGAIAAGALAGDSALRKMSQDILSAVGSGAGTLGSLNAVGIGLKSTGQLSFDKKDFDKAYAADPAKVQAFFDSFSNRTLDPGDPADAMTRAKADSTAFQPVWDTAHGLARKLETVSVLATEGVRLPIDPATTNKQGILAGLIQRRTESIKTLNDQVSAWDLRLEKRKSALERQFASLEVAMGKMQQQSSWLAGQLATLS